jgi:hypothetical protein
MNMALQKTSQDLGLAFNEYTVTGKPYQGLFSHHWYVGTDAPVDNRLLKEKIDHYLKELNDDYVVERKHALKEIFVHQLPLDIFHKFLERRGKIGGQTKFPRVLKGKLLEDWETFLKEQHIHS